ncbi:MAG: HAD family phosphatase [Pseudomonadota bacterium]
MTPAAVLFDLDGVLVLSAPAHLAAYAAILAREGRAFSMEDYERVGLGRSRREVLLRLLPGLGEARLAALMAEKERFTREHIAAHGLPEVPGALALVRALRARGVPVAVATASRTPGLLLGAIGAEDLFDAVVGGGEVTRPKPDPACYLRAAALLGVQPARCLVVEDSPLGVRAGKAAGCRVLAVTTTATAEALREAGADEVLAGFDEGAPWAARDLSWPG